MSRIEEVELTNMCMICDGKGNVLVQNKVNHRASLLPKLDKILCFAMELPKKK